MAKRFCDHWNWVTCCAECYNSGADDENPMHALVEKMAEALGWALPIVAATESVSIVKNGTTGDIKKALAAYRTWKESQK